MESSSYKTSLLDVDEEGANISTFRRRNKILILGLLLLMILLTLSLAALIINLIQTADFPDSNDKVMQFYNPALEAFCNVNSDAAACISSLFTLIIRFKFVSNPNQIFALSLEAAAEDLERSIALISSDTNCSKSLILGIDRTRDPLLTALRLDPFVEARSDEQRAEMMERITAVEEDVEACLDELGGAVVEELVRAKVYLNGAGDFLIGYAAALQMFESDKRAKIRRGVFMDHVFVIWIFTVPQFVFIIALFCSLFRIRPRRSF